MEKELIEWWYQQSQVPPIRIYDHGCINPTDGPDITDCSIEINGSRYRGAIEFDPSSSDWFAHGHFQHPRYQNVILHITGSHNILMYHGNMPTFTLDVSDQTLLVNNALQPSHFLDRHQSFISQYSRWFDPGHVTLILIARTLGYYHLRESTMHFMMQWLRGVHPVCHPVAKEVRPKNRFDIRCRQMERLPEGFNVNALLQELGRISAPVSVLTDELYDLLNLRQSRDERIGRERIHLFLFNWVLPLFKMNGWATDSHIQALGTVLQRKPLISRFHKEIRWDF